LALGNKRQLLLVETFFNLMHLALIYIGIEILGLLGVSVAFLIVNVLYAFTVYFIGSRQTNFSWSGRTWRLFIYSASILVANFLISLAFPLSIATISGILFTIATGIYSARWIIRELGDQHRLSRILSRVPLIGAILRAS
jgi:O-antigen/teichoic acid export membrane protein